MASNAVVGSLRVNLGLDSAEFENSLARSGKQAKTFARETEASMGALAKGVSAAAAGIRAGLAGLTFAAVTSAIQGSVSALAELGDQAKRSGLSLQSFQEWRFVAERNRIGLDAMVDGFKELNLRADEFITTGGGSAAEAFQRLGFSAEDLAKRMADPSEMMLEIIKRLGDLDKAAQIRIFDELLGGSGGEQFVQLIDQGEKGLRATIRRAHELGGVLQDDVIKKASEIDKQFQEIAATINNGFKAAVVGVVSSLDQMLNRLDKVGKQNDDTVAARLDETNRELTQLQSLADSYAPGSLQKDAFLSQFGPRLEALKAEKFELETVLNLRKAFSAVEFGGNLPPVGSGAPPTTPQATGGASAPAEDPVAAQLASRIESLKLALSTERELEVAAHQQRQADLLASFESGKMAREEYNQWTEREQAAHAERMSAIAENQAASERQKLQDTFSFTADTFGSLATLAQTFGEKGFAAAKAFGIAEAVVNTAVGVTKALELPFPVNMAAAASVAAAGAAQIATILSARPGGSSRPSVRGAAVATTPPAGSRDTGGDGGGRVAYINIQGSSVTVTKDQALEMFRQLQELIDDGYKLKF